jgi:flagellum-specific ATP synthase
MSNVARGTADVISNGLGTYMTQLANRPAWRWSGRVLEANGQTVEAEGPLCSVGECCEIVDSEGLRHRAEVIGFRGRHVLAMPLKETQGIRYGDAVLAMGVTPQIAVGTEMQGRIVDALGAPLDGMPTPRAAEMWPLDGTVPHPMEREPIREPLQTGLRVLDGMLTVGRGQRVGIFGGSGVGKSTLIGMEGEIDSEDLSGVLETQSAAATMSVN